MEILTEKQIMDTEWVQLIMEARELGLTPREIRDFLQMGREERMFPVEKEREP